MTTSRRKARILVLLALAAVPVTLAASSPGRGAEKQILAAEPPESLQGQRSPAAREALNRSQAAASQDKAQEALREAQRAVDLAPDWAEAWRSVATLSSWNGLYEEAFRAWSRVSELVPGDREAALGRARTAAWSGETDRAAKLYEALLDDSPSVQPSVVVEAARVTSWQGNGALALELLEALEKEGQTAAADALPKEGASEPVEPPQRPVESAEARALALLTAGRPFAAQSLLESWVPRYRDRASLQGLWLLALAGSGHPDAAQEGLARLRALAPDTPETREVERLVGDPLRSSGRPYLDLYDDSDSVRSTAWGLTLDLALTARSRLSFGAEERDLEAEVKSGLAAPGGRDVRIRQFWFQWQQTVSPNLELAGRLGREEVLDGNDLSIYRAEAKWRPGDSLLLDLAVDRGFLAVSPRALALGIYGRDHRAAVEWRPNLRWVVDASASWQDLSDGNGRWSLRLGPRRQALRRQRFNLDLGLAGWWLAFDEDLGNGYYAPSSYERYAFTAFGYWKLSAASGVSVVASAGWFQDESLDSFRFGGDLTLEGSFRLSKVFTLALRAGVTDNQRQQTGAFRAYGGNVSLTARF